MTLLANDVEAAKTNSSDCLSLTTTLILTKVWPRTATKVPCRRVCTVIQAQ